MKEPILTLTKKDFIVETFRGSGKGGQHRNKTDSAVRIKHPASGAVGECQEERSQHRNKQVAFKRLTNSFKFKQWHRLRISEILEKETLEEKVEKMMNPSNLKVEGKSNTGKWEEIG